MVSRRLDIPDSQLTMGDTMMKQVGNFSYLRSLITSDRRNDGAFKKRIGMSKTVFAKIRKVLKKRKMSMKTKL